MQPVLEKVKDAKHLLVDPGGVPLEEERLFGFMSQGLGGVAEEEVVVDVDAVEGAGDAVLFAGGETAAGLGEGAFFVQVVQSG